MSGPGWARAKAPNPGLNRTRVAGEAARTKGGLDLGPRSGCGRLRLIEMCVASFVGQYAFLIQIEPLAQSSRESIFVISCSLSASSPSAQPGVQASPRRGTRQLPAVPSPRTTAPRVMCHLHRGDSRQGRVQLCYPRFPQTYFRTYNSYLSGLSCFSTNKKK